MRDDLVLLAWSNAPQATTVRDKYLDGYSTIQYVCEIHGALFLAYDERSWELSEGAWFFPAHPGPRLRFHPMHAGDYWHHRHVAFQGPLVESWRAAGLWLDGAQAAPPQRDWAAHFDGLIELFGRTDRMGRLRAINGIEALLLELAEARAGQWENLQDAEREAQPWLDGVLRVLDAEGDGGEVSLNHIAAGIGWSATELRRRFKASTGITMQEHVLQGRIARARALLLDTDLPLKAIAHRLGYANEFYFSRQFKERTGAAPGAWRKSR